MSILYRGVSVSLQKFFGRSMTKSFQIVDMNHHMTKISVELIWIIIWWKLSIDINHHSTKSFHGVDMNHHSTKSFNWYESSFAEKFPLISIIIWAVNIAGYFRIADCASQESICMLRYWSVSGREHFVFGSCPLFPTLREIFSKFYQIKPKSDCICHFPIDLEPNGCPFGPQSIGKW